MIRLHNSCAHGGRIRRIKTIRHRLRLGLVARPRLPNAHEHALHLGIPLLQHRKRIARRLQQMLVVQRFGRFSSRPAGLVVHYQRRTRRCGKHTRRRNVGKQVDFALKERRGRGASHLQEERHFCAHIFAGRNACSHIAGEPPLKRRIQAGMLRRRQAARALKRMLTSRVGTLKHAPRTPCQHRQLRQPVKRCAQIRCSVSIFRGQRRSVLLIFSIPENTGAVIPSVTTSNVPARHIGT